MDKQRIPMTPGPASQLEYVDVTIGGVTLQTTKLMADRFIEQMKKQPEYSQQFYNPARFR